MLSVIAYGLLVHICTEIIIIKGRNAECHKDRFRDEGSNFFSGDTST